MLRHICHRDFRYLGYFALIVVSIVGLFSCRTPELKDRPTAKTTPVKTTPLAKIMPSTPVADMTAPLPHEVTVVELFTSQGCSSCPPADRLLSELGNRDDIIALAFHVDYWNDLGWEDPFSAPAWSQRQYRYARQLRSRVYTPQMVINGRIDVVGSRPAEVHAALAEHGQTGVRALDIAAARNGDMARVHIDVQAKHRPANESNENDASAVSGRDNLVFVVAVRESQRRTEVVRGENRGRTLTDDYAVRHVEVLSETSSDSGELAIALDPAWSGALSVAVLLQNPQTGVIHAAAQTPL